MEAAEPLLLASGVRSFPRAGLPAAQLSALPSCKLQPSHFPACPTEVPGWRELSKSALKKAMLEVQWVKLRAERERRRAAALASPPAAAGSCSGAAADADAGAGAGAALRRAAAAGTGARKRSRPLEAMDAPDGPSHHPLLVVDCSFDALMTPSESCSLTKQLVHAYAAVKRTDRSPACARLLLADLSAARVEALCRIVGASAWRLHSTPGSLQALFPAAVAAAAAAAAAPLPPPAACAVGSPPPLAFCAALPPARLVYLTSEAADVLWDPQPGTAYVIGGIVDRNRHKGLTLDKAAALGLPTARLPLTEVFEELFPAAAGAGSSGGGGGSGSAARKNRVLTVNKVVELLSRVCSAGARRAGEGALHGGPGGAESTGAGAARPAARPCAQHWVQAVRAVLFSADGSVSPSEDRKEGSEGDS